MIYIKRSKNGQFFSDTINDSNKKVLANTETETQKHNIWKNIFAQAFCFRGTTYKVTDLTLKNPKIYSVTDGEKTLIK